MSCYMSLIWHQQGSDQIAQKKVAASSFLFLVSEVQAQLMRWRMLLFSCVSNFKQIVFKTTSIYAAGCRV